MLIQNIDRKMVRYKSKRKKAELRITKKESKANVEQIRQRCTLMINEEKKIKNFLSRLWDDKATVSCTNITVKIYRWKNKKICLLQKSYFFLSLA